MPTLEEVLDQYAQKTTLLLEIKADEHDKRHQKLTEEIIKTLETRDLIDQVYLLCFDPRVLKMALKINSQCRCVINLDSLDPNCENSTEIIDDCAAVSMNIKALDDSAADYVKAKEKILMAWTCNNDEDFAKAQQKKAGYVMTDKPAVLTNK